MEIKCQECGEYYKDSFGQCPLCTPPKKDDKPHEAEIPPARRGAPAKKCRYCAMIIPPETKICPHCQTRVKAPSIIKYGLLFFLALLFFFAFLIAEPFLLKSKITTPPTSAIPKTATPAIAVDEIRYVSEPEAIFCLDLQAINNLKTFMAQNDKNATAKLFDKEDCVIVKPSLNVFIVQEKGDLVRVRREGMTDSLWTFRGALR